MTRLVLEQECAHGGMSPHLVGDVSLGVDLPECLGGVRTVVDLSALPERAIEAAAKRIHRIALRQRENGEGPTWKQLAEWAKVEYRKQAKAALRAGLSALGEEGK